MILIAQLRPNPISAVSVSLLFSTGAKNLLLSLAMGRCSPGTA